uniref:telomeric repeat-binding factor 2-interacting protein 1 n=1 Tax=Myxine glutinosa TaxID=7769 RepID=UPI00358FAC80
MIKLAALHEKSEKMVFFAYGDDYYCSSFIIDSVECNENLELEDYRVSKIRAAGMDKGDRGYNGRIAYTPADDLAILDYIKNLAQGNSLTGNLLWKEMEKSKVTNHSWSSMKCRYLKKLHGAKSFYKMSTHQSLSDRSHTDDNEEPGTSHTHGLQAATRDESRTPSPVRKGCLLAATPDESRTPSPVRKGGLLAASPDESRTPSPVRKGGLLAAVCEELLTQSPVRKVRRCVAKLVTPEDSSASNENDDGHSDEKLDDKAESHPEAKQTAMNTIQWLIAETNAELNTVVHALLRTNGNVMASKNLLIYGAPLPGVHLWTVADDNLLKEGSQSSLAILLSRHDHKAVTKRRHFLNDP